MADFTTLDSLRVDLEQQITKLRGTLRHWQLWEAEYDGFKEEVESLDESASTHDLLQCGLEFGGDIVDEREIKDLLQYTRPQRRSRSEVLAAIAARADTGQRNAVAIQKQLDKAVAKLEELNTTDSEPQEQEPVMEIIEDLDDEDNVVSSRVVDANKQTDWLDKTLQAAQAKSLLPTSPAQDKSTPLPARLEMTTTEQAPKDRTDSAVELPEGMPTNFQTAPSTAGIKVRAQEIIELDEHDQVIGKRTMDNVPLTVDETIEHQKEMMRNAAEIGPIVATMDLESDPEFSDEDVGSGASWSSDELEENEYGMNNISNELTPSYLAEMKALLDKYQPMILNLGPEDAGFPRANAINKLPTPMNEPVRAPSPPSALKSPTSIKKSNSRVRFADDLEIEAAKSEKAKAEKPSKTTSQQQSTATIIDIVERRPVHEAQAPQPFGSSKPKKMSRFKASQMSSLEAF